MPPATAPLALVLTCTTLTATAQTASTPSLLPSLPSMPLPAVGISGSVTGAVTLPDGSLVQGAQLVLHYPSGRPDRTVVSNRDGRFTFADVAPGPFTLSVTLDGFDPLTLTGDLGIRQSLALSLPPLKLSTLAVTVDAVASTEELGTEQVTAEEHQRLAGVLPNFFVSYNWSAPPLTTHQKFALATKNALDPGNLALSATVAGFQQAVNAFPGYRQGAAGYGKRFGADYANLMIGTYMGGAILPTLFHQDPRYFYKGTGSVRSRFLYAISTAIICRGDNGHRQPAFASVGGDLAAGALSNLYYAKSDRQGATLTLENGFLGVAGDAMNNVVQEFFLKMFTKK